MTYNHFKVHSQLCAENLTHHTDNPYTIKEIHKAALFVVSHPLDTLHSPQGFLTGFPGMYFFESGLLAADAKIMVSRVSSN